MVAGASAPSPGDAALDALAAALVPRVLRLLREQAANDDSDSALRELLNRAGFEVDGEGTP